MKVTTDELLTKIGRQSVEIDALRAQISLLIAVRCPDLDIHKTEEGAERIRKDMGEPA